MPTRRLATEDARRLSQHVDRIEAAKARIALAQAHIADATRIGNRALAQFRALAARYGADAEGYGVELDESSDNFGLVMNTATGQPVEFAEAPEPAKPLPLPTQKPEASTAPSEPAAPAEGADAPEVTVSPPAT